MPTPKHYTRKVDKKMKDCGETDFEKKKIRVNPKQGNLLNTILHEEAHRKFPKKTEKQISSMAEKQEKKLNIKSAVKLLKKFDIK